jgi:ParB-like chromosome segregation protein Spo0J
MSVIATEAEARHDEPVDETLLVWLEPRELSSHPANMRFDLRDLDELAESIAESGIVEPLVVVPVEGGHRIVAGHRRGQPPPGGEETSPHLP